MNAHMHKKRKNAKRDLVLALGRKQRMFRDQGKDPRTCLALATVWDFCHGTTYVERYHA